MDEWCRKTMAEMAYYRISRRDLAKALRCTEAYVSMILSGKRQLAGAGGLTREEIDKVLDELVKEAQKQIGKETN